MSIHKPVLLKEVIELLNLKKGSVVVDATLGGGGHSREILRKIGDGGILIAIDADKEAIEGFELKVKSEKFPPKADQPLAEKVEGNIFLINDNFANLGAILKETGIEKVDAILADLGWSSDQMGDAHRGMSFLSEAELDMRLDQRQELTARKIVNEYKQEELERVIKNYGEERWAKRIVQKISEYRKNKKIETTKELVGIIQSAIPKKFWGKIHPATRTFQAIRIEVNQELKNLEKFIPQAISALSPGGRLAIISFHSLEDRIVKNIYRANARGRVRTDEITGQTIVETAPEIRIVTKKPVISGEEELENNPRARSAKLRVAEKTKKQ